MLRGKWRVVAELAGILLVCSALFAQTDSTTSKTTTSKTTSSKTKTPATHKSSATSKPVSKSTSASHTSHSTTAKTKSASSSTSSRRGKKSKKSAKRGQEKIDSERTQQIQEALIKQHYLSGEPTGKWDAATEDALRKFQGDNGWQNKTVPDSRALIKLGLGPSHDHLLNPESAMTTVLETPSTPTASNRPVAHDSAPSQTQPQQ